MLNRTSCLSKLSYIIYIEYSGQLSVSLQPSAYMFLGVVGECFPSVIFSAKKNFVLRLWSSISYGCTMTYPATTYIPVSSFSSAPRANYAYNYYKCYRDTRTSFSGMGHDCCAARLQQACRNFTRNHPLLLARN